MAKNTSAAVQLDGLIEKVGASGRVAVVEHAYAALKQKILNNEFPPNYQALEQEIADLLGVSRTPVREILTRLQDEGLIERLPRRGFRVLPLTPDDIHGLADVLSCLEVRAVELLAEQNLAADAEPLRLLEAANAHAIEALARDDREGWADADREFHRTILQFCGNRHLTRTGFSVWDQFHRADMITLRIRPMPVKSTPDHESIIAAIRAHDVKDAARRLARHRRDGREAIIASLEKFGFRQL
ncbi:MAG: GntR family transcriptional regulator [Rhodospirillales bacterium]|nr:GntR family transcriptional regulator [Rhodospirillales bacterium]